MNTLNTIYNWNILQEGEIGRTIRSDDPRGFKSTLKDFFTTGQTDLSKVSAVKLKRLRRKDPEAARELFRKSNPHGLAKLNPFNLPGTRRDRIRRKLITNYDKENPTLSSKVKSGLKKAGRIATSPVTVPIQAVKDVKHGIETVAQLPNALMAFA